MAKKKKSSDETVWILPVSVEVIVPKFGTYKEGDVISPMYRSTADALVKHKVIKILKDVPNPKAKK
jgi:hypothetical protein